MEQWRLCDSSRQKTILLMLSSVALGGCGIWAMHFTGMNAMTMVLEDGTILEIDFDLGITIASFIFPVVGVFIGLKVASVDPFFLAMEQSRRKEILVLRNRSVFLGLPGLKADFECSRRRKVCRR